MKKILFRKILNDCLIFFFISLICSSLIVWVFQAVNFLDIMIEDGRDYAIYINYTLLNFPKIISKILPFALFFSFSYVITKYELNNEMIIFWNFGINKVQLINFFLKISLLLMIFQIIFTSLLVPRSQELSRSLMKNSNIDFFESFIKPKKFNDSIRDFTIFVGSKTDDGLLQNIYLKKDMGNDSFQITISKNGKFVQKGNAKFLELYNGQTISGSKNNISNFNFSKSDFSLSNLKADVVTLNKLQETSTLLLTRCIAQLNNFKFKFLSASEKINMHNCEISGLDNIYKELYKRFIIPFYIPILILISLLLILYSKENINYFKYRTLIFFCGFITIVFSETTLKFIQGTLIGNIQLILIPIISFSILYVFTLSKLKKIQITT
mgnify:FL=1